RFIPMVDLAPRMQSIFDRLQHSFQDAVASDDKEMLKGTNSLKDEFEKQIVAAQDIVGIAEAESLRGAFNNYYLTAMDVSQRLITHETGESIVMKMDLLQRQQTHLAERLQSVTAFDRNLLSKAFLATTNSLR